MSSENLSLETVVKHTFNSMLMEALKKHLKLELYYTPKPDRLEIIVNFQNETIVQETVYLEHDHKED